MDNFESIWEVVERPEGDEILGVPEQEYKDYDTRRERLAFTGGIEVRPDNLNRFFVRGTWSRRIDDEYRNLLAVIYSDGALQPGASEGVATWNNTRVEKEWRHRIVRDQSLAVSAGGEHELNALTLDYSAAYTRAKQDYPIRAQLRFRSSLRPNISQDFAANPDQPAISLFTTGQHLDETRYAFRENTFREQDTVQDEWSFQANAKLPLSLLGSPATLQLGGRARLREITSDNEQWRDRRASSAPGVPMAELLGDEPSQNFDYLLGRKFDPQSVRDYFEAIRSVSQTDATRRISNSIVSDFAAKEDVYSGYVMTRMELPQTNVILGLRVEQTRFSGSAPVFNAVTETFAIQDVGRQRRPPPDPINAVLSFGYSMLANECTAACRLASLEPTLGALHSTRPGRPALSLDLMEPFRPLIADSVAVSAFNRGELCDGHFLNTASGCALTDSGRKGFFSAYGRRMDTEVKHPVFEYRLNYRRMLMLHARLISAWLPGEVPTLAFLTTR
ncbi:CRISPR-associated endonuclease Cas1 [Leptolyngbya sp. 7M]|uniref:CRISPR-associated endonuclease Cas1 n=1 Tax=Leptolyngbya sp. 7M TaxID=2812896 RepID=UPI001B8CAC94|nr:CRISPR-associated endonuclease Cas1 [Leptolyngbya sp. 7M]QYO64924.1 CRISPR-associated endonuclease Cas1 [Leptolyngbya sp. 7M]